MTWRENLSAKGLECTLSQLRSFSQVNFSGFRKALKKYDKPLAKGVLQQFCHPMDIRVYKTKSGHMAVLLAAKMLCFAGDR